MLKQLARLAALSLMLASATALAAEPSMRTQSDANEVGIWKSYTPKGFKGELHNYDPIGLIAGDLIHTDCSINFTDPDNGKTYCFNSATSLTYFEHWPKSYARRAAEALEKIKSEQIN